MHCDMFVSTQKIETIINASHPVWNSRPYAQEPTPVGILTYNGKNLAAMLPPNRLIYYHESQKLGSGFFGTVYEGASYQISYPLKKLTYKKDKVVKVIKNVDAKKREAILAEYVQGVKAPQLGMKEPIFSGDIDNQTCYIVMNRLPGKELYDLVKDGSIGSLPVNKKIALTHKLLLALRDQVTHKDIVHRDLKAENIMVQLEPVIEVNIIDYGLAKEHGTDDGRHPGSPAYAAPELFQGRHHDSACDVFSMAKVIALLWVKNFLLYDTDKCDASDISIQSAELLIYCQSVELKQNSAIFYMLRGMLAQNQLNRLTINQAIESFEKAYPICKQVIEKKAQKITENKGGPGEVSNNNFSEGLNEPLILKTSYSTKNIHKYLYKLDVYAEKHKNLQYILKNIAAAVVRLGLFYGVACGINKLATGRATFFHNEIRNAQFNIKKEINSIAVVT